MKLRFFCLILAVCLLFTGCSNWMDGSYSSVKPHAMPHSPQTPETLAAFNYSQLYSILCSLVSSGTEKAIINAEDYPQGTLERDIHSAVTNLTTSYPIGVYAVSAVDYVVGTGNGSQPAISVNITYRHNFAEIQRIQTVIGAEEAKAAIENAIAEYDDNLLLLVERYSAMDLQQIADDFGLLHPEMVIEVPQVTASDYPETGGQRVLEIKFTYQTSRETLRQMQTQVATVFASAKLYISSEDADYQKYSQLCAFLMERFDYRLETSITPAYSLLRHGVGNSKAFATVYASMCSQVGLECLVISGTRAGESHFWNLICDNGRYYHLDLLPHTPGVFEVHTDAEMTDYVWDYSAYPASES